MAEMYLSKNGTLVKEGDVIRNPSLADALEKLNRHDYVFYNNGALGQDLVAELTQNEVEQITREDLNEYSEKEDKLTKIEFDG
jgi:gamma-glutamyltranspeptidase